MKTGEEIYKLINRRYGYRDYSKKLEIYSLEKDGIYFRDDAIFITPDANEDFMEYLWENRMREYREVIRSLPWREFRFIPILMKVEKDGKWLFVKERELPSHHELYMKKDWCWLISKENPHEKP